jgi:hypothetical protein
MNPQISQIREARAFVDGALLLAALERGTAHPLPQVVLTRADGTSALPAVRECSICEELKPASEFRQVIGRVTTEACASCCDRREEAVEHKGGTLPTRLRGPELKEFCRRVALKRFERAGRIGQIRPIQKKGESALAKSPEEYATWLQRLPDRVAAIIGKTVAVQGDGFTLEDDTALIYIMDEINRGDDTAIERNKNKRLAPRKS